MRNFQTFLFHFDIAYNFHKLKIARINGKPALEGQLELSTESGISQRGRIQDLVTKERRKLTFVQNPTNKC